MCSNHPRKILPVTLILIVLLLALTVSGLGQSLYDKKDTIFTQVFAGPAGTNVYMSSISVTNRGTLPYNGTLFFGTGINNQWNPLVNGSQVANGAVNVLIMPDATEVFAVTSNSFTVGYALLVSDDWSLDNYVEGNLSYFSFSGSTLMDAVGVPESKEFLVSSLPFDMYSDVGLSLVNPSNGPAEVDVLLFDPDGGLPAANCTFTLQAGEHYAKYLTELPWFSNPAGFGPVGKVEISSDVPIAGIAMLITPGSAAGAQISTLPLGGTPLTYMVEFEGTGDALGQVYEGELTLWIEGFFVKGYLKLTTVNDSAVADPYGTMPILVNGQLIDTELDLAFFTGSYFVDQDEHPAWPNVDNFGAVVYIYVSDFTPSANVLGDGIGYTRWTAYHAWDNDQALMEGTLVLDNTIF